GFVALWGVGQVFPPLDAWLLGAWMTSADPSTVGGFLFVLITSIASGITVSTVRWLVIDRIHHWTRLKRPEWDDAKLQDKLAAFVLGTHERTVCDDERTLLRNGRPRRRKAGARGEAGAESARDRKAGRPADREDD